MEPHTSAVCRLLERHYFALLVTVMALAALLRFSLLSTVPHAYFDEINIPHFGYALLQDLRQTPFMTAHPPLPHYLFAGAIALYYQLPWIDGGLPDQWAAVDPLSYRWLTALLGVLCCGLVAGIVRRLGGGQWVALLAALFMAIDGALIVDSRAGLNNIVMLFFGLAALWLFAMAVADQWRWRYLLLSGVLLGATVSVKWNGLGFWLVPAGCVGLLWIWSVPMRRPAAAKDALLFNQWPLDAAFIVRVGVALLLVPLAVYWLLWQPYLLHEQQWGFGEIHARMRAFHTQQVGANDHPYCSAWYQWPYQGRPMSYFFERVPLDAGQGFKAIHLLANPLLYPLSFLAVLWCSWQWIRHWGAAMMARPVCQSVNIAFITVVLLGFWGNFLPWALVSRCLFAYHYEPASAFAFAALAACLVGAWGTGAWPRRLAVAGILGLIIAAFFYWLPLALGWPLSAEAFYQRMWFTSWI